MKAIFATLILLVSIFVPVGIQAAAPQPWIITLDSDKGVCYFDSKGRQLSRTKIVSPTKIEDYIAIELGDFIPEDNWLELILLRKSYWFETFSLPRPGDKSAKRMDYYRYRPVSNKEPLGLSLVNYPKDPSKLAMLVPVTASGEAQLSELVLYETLNTADRSQAKVMSINTDWEEVPGKVLLASLGLNCTYVNIAAVVESSGLWLGRVDEAGEVRWLARGLELPESFEPKSLRLVADRIYILDTKSRIQMWTIEGNQIKRSGKPVRLKLPVDIISFTPLQRQTSTQS